MVGGSSQHVRPRRSYNKTHRRELLAMLVENVQVRAPEDYVAGGMAFSPKATIDCE